MRTVAAYLAQNSTDPLGPGTIERREVGPHDVRIEIHWSGICHSDIHTCCRIFEIGQCYHFHVCDSRC